MFKSQKTIAVAATVANVAKHGKIFSVSYVSRVDGTIKKTTCRLDVKAYKQAKNLQNENDALLASCYKMNGTKLESSGFRSFDLQNVLSIRGNRQQFYFNK
jgi:hypothetical protein